MKPFNEPTLLPERWTLTLVQPLGWASQNTKTVDIVTPPRSRDEVALSVRFEAKGKLSSAAHSRIQHTGSKIQGEPTRSVLATGQDPYDRVSAPSFNRLQSHKSRPQ